MAMAASGNHHVAAEVPAGPAHLAPHQIGPGDDRLVVHAEANRGFPAFGDVGLLLFGAEIAMAVVVAGGAVLGGLALPHLGEFRFAGVAAVGLAGIQQLLNGGAVLSDALALDDGLAVPVDAEPLQAFQDVGGVFGLAALLVGVLDPQQELPAVMPREEPVEDGGPRRADVKRAGGAGGETHTDRRSSFSHWSCLES
jgi:hypothetical protein